MTEQRLRALAADVDRATAALKAAVVAELDAGTPPTQVSEWTGRTRMTLYRWHQRHQDTDTTQHNTESETP